LGVTEDINTISHVYSFLLVEMETGIIIVQKV